jgi:hypothetical protein
MKSTKHHRMNHLNTTSNTYNPEINRSAGYPEVQKRIERS